MFKKKKTTKKVVAILICFAMLMTTFGLPVFTKEVSAKEPEVGSATFDKRFECPCDGSCELCQKGEHEQCADLNRKSHFISLETPVTLSWNDLQKAENEEKYHFSLINNDTIGEEAFDGCEALTSITIPAGVTSIGEAAFAECNSLTSITIPDSVTSMGGYTFYECSSLESVTLSKNITQMSDYMFFECPCLESVEIPNVVTRIGAYAFCGCADLLDVNIPEAVTSIGESAFSECEHLSDVYIPKAVDYLGNFVFNECTNLNELNVDENNTTYTSRDASGQACNAIISIKDKELIAGTNSTVIPSGVEKIKSFAFSGRANLKSITLPASVIRVDGNAFYLCTKLQEITIMNPNVDLGTNCFYFCNALNTIYLNCLNEKASEGKDDYWSKRNVSDYQKKIKLLHEYLPEDSTNHKCANCHKLEKHALPEGNVYCTNDSETHKWTCPTCGDVAIENHDYTSQEFFNDGKGKHYRKCKCCGEESEHVSCKDTLVPFEKKDATCEEEGNIGCYVCEKCGVYYSDAEAMNALSEDEVVIPAKHHSLKHEEKVDSNCTKPGSMEYWKCTNEGCGKIFADADGKVSTSLSELVVAPKGHVWNTDYTVDLEATEQAEGSKSIHCSICDEMKENSSVSIPVKKTTPTNPPSNSPEPSLTPSNSPEPTLIPSSSPEPSLTPSSSPEPSLTPSSSPVPSPIPSNSPEPSLTPSSSPVPSTNPGINPITSPYKVGDKVVDAKSKAVFVITSIGKNSTVAFVRMTSKKATSVKLPSTIKLAKKLYKVTAIVDNAFKNYKKLTKVTLGSNITAIGKNAFSGCVRLKSIVIGKKVSKLGANLFKGCKKIKRITIKGSKLKTKLVSPRAFKGLSKKVVIKVPVKQLKYYKKIFKKKGFKGKVR